MKTLSVKDVAFALNMTPRGVVQRLNKGQLKGTRRTNQFGTQEWVVYATKEITQALADKRGDATKGTGEYNFSPDAETIDAEEVYPDNIKEEPSWREQEIERLELLAEKLVKPLTEKIAAQAMMINAQEQQLEDQKRQIKLLPDLEKRAEEERKAAELRALEVEALNKQIAALEEERKSQEMKLEKVDALEAKLATVNAELEQLKQPWWKKLFSTQ
jgi:hypothetical protein